VSAILVGGKSYDRTISFESQSFCFDGKKEGSKRWVEKRETVSTTTSTAKSEGARGGNDGKQAAPSKASKWRFQSSDLTDGNRKERSQLAIAKPVLYSA